MWDPPPPPHAPTHSSQTPLTIYAAGHCGRAPDLPPLLTVALRRRGGGWRPPPSPSPSRPVHAPPPPPRVSQVLQKPATPTAIRHLFGRLGLPLRDNIEKVRPRAILKNGARDVRRRGHATVNAYTQFLRSAGELVAESAASGSEFEGRRLEFAVDKEVAPPPLPVFCGHVPPAVVLSAPLSL